jgi:hypothetical protein
MIEQAECDRCHDDYEVRDGCEPSEFCDSCAHIVIDEQRIRMKEMELCSHFLSEALKAANAIPNPVEQNLRELLKKLRAQVWSLEIQLENEKINFNISQAKAEQAEAKLLSYILEPPTKEELAHDRTQNR